MSIFGQKSIRRGGYIFSVSVPKNREERISLLNKNSKQITELMLQYAQELNLESPKTFTERDLIYYLYLNPTGDMLAAGDSSIMNSSIAKKYFEIGILTKGVSDEMSSQYRLTAFGRSQIKNALDLEMLS